MKIKMIMLVTLIVILAATGIAQAQGGYQSSRQGAWEVSLQTRYITSSDHDGSGGSKVHIDDDLGWGFGFGYNITHNFNLGLNFTWRAVPYQATIVDGANPNNTQVYSNWLDTGNIMLHAEYALTRTRIAPYVSGSIGWMAIDTNIYAGSDYACWWDPWWGYVCSGYNYSYGDDVAAYGLGAGGRIELTRNAFLRVGYEHGWIGGDTYTGKNILRIDLGFLTN
jgi:opacity protein-like surface antigen